MTFNLKIGKTIYVKSEVYYLLNILKLSYVYINIIFQYHRRKKWFSHSKQRGVTLEMSVVQKL